MQSLEIEIWGAWFKLRSGRQAFMTRGAICDLCSIPYEAGWRATIPAFAARAIEVEAFAETLEAEGKIENDGQVIITPGHVRRN